jgi:hypothetical protein
MGQIEHNRSYMKWTELQGYSDVIIQSKFRHFALYIYITNAAPHVSDRQDQPERNHNPNPVTPLQL